MDIVSFANVVRWYLVNTKGQVINIGTKWRPRKLCSGASQITISRTLLSFRKAWKGKHVVWPAPGARNGARQQTSHSGRSLVYRNQLRSCNKTNKQGAIGAIQSDNDNSYQERIIFNNQLWGCSVVLCEVFAKIFSQIFEEKYLETISGN